MPSGDQGEMGFSWHRGQSMGSVHSPHLWYLQNCLPAELLITEPNPGEKIVLNKAKKHGVLKIGGATTATINWAFHPGPIWLPEGHFSHLVHLSLPKKKTWVKKCVVSWSSNEKFCYSAVALLPSSFCRRLWFVQQKVSSKWGICWGSRHPRKKSKGRDGLGTAWNWHSKT